MHELVQERTATLRVRPGPHPPIRIQYEDGRWSDTLYVLAGGWVLLEAAKPVPGTHREVLDLAAYPVNAFDADLPV